MGALISFFFLQKSKITCTVGVFDTPDVEALEGKSVFTSMRFCTGVQCCGILSGD